MLDENSIYMQSLILGLGAILCILAGWLLRMFFASKRLRIAEQKAKELTAGAKTEFDAVQRILTFPAYRVRSQGRLGIGEAVFVVPNLTALGEHERSIIWRKT